MIKINDEIKENKIAIKMLLQIHDELIFETPVSQKTVVEKAISKAMVSVSKSDKHKFSIPLEVNINTGNNWEEAH